MAGRPKMMFKRVDALAKEMESVGKRFHAMMPEMYKKPDAVPDRICEAWRHAANMADESLEAIDELLGELARKAGIEQTPRFPRPAPIFFELDDRMTFDGDTATLRMWCERYDRDPQLIRRRLAAGYDIELAVTAPPTEEEMLAGYGSAWSRRHPGECDAGDCEKGPAGVSRNRPAGHDGMHRSCRQFASEGVRAPRNAAGESTARTVTRQSE